MKPYITLKNAIFAAGLALGAYHLMVVSGVFVISTMPMRITHVMLALSLLFVIKPASDRLEGTRLNAAISIAMSSRKNFARSRHQLGRTSLLIAKAARSSSDTAASA